MEIWKKTDWRLLQECKYALFFKVLILLYLLWGLSISLLNTEQ